MKLYSTQITASGGRTGRATSNDGRLEVALSVPRGLGGDDGPGTNPEQLFAAGYAACFDSALRLVARREKIDLGDDSQMIGEVALERTAAGLFQLAVVLTGRFPTLSRPAAEALMAAAHQICPYSNATRGNISVELRVAETGQTSATSAAGAA